MTVTERSGKVDFVVGNEVFQTWYKVVGDLKSGAIPLVTLHGGPGMTHSLVLAHTDLSEFHDRPVVFYDQLGAGQSTRLPQKGTEFWTFELFMDELDNLLAHLGIADEFDLLGHSWGGMLAASYLCAGRGRGIRRLVLVSAPASIKLWEAGAQKLLLELPEDTREMMKRHEAAGTFDDPEYVAAMNLFYAKHVCRLDSWPEDVSKAMGELKEEHTVYGLMQGPNEFHVTGSLKPWTVVDKIHTITKPTLLINGGYDEAHDVCMSPFFEKLPNVKWVTMMNSAHVSFYEERERYMGVVSSFLSDA